jgi:hypothetical protein
MRYSYLPGPEWNWFPEQQKRSQRQVDRESGDNSPGKVLAEMALVFGLSLGVVLFIDAAVILIEFPLKALHFG